MFLGSFSRIGEYEESSHVKEGLLKYLYTYTKDKTS